jgi:hypothetical protein
VVTKENSEKASERVEVFDSDTAGKLIEMSLVLKLKFQLKLLMIIYTNICRFRNAGYFFILICS